MFIEFSPDLNHDRTFCTAKTCTIKECGRHPFHHPKGVRFISLADFEPVCRTYIATVVEEVEQHGNR